MLDRGHLDRDHDDRDAFAASRGDIPFERLPPLRRVSRDMEDIFGPAQKRDLTEHKPRSTDLVVSMTARQRRWLRPPRMAAPLMALGGLAMCAGLWALLATLDRPEPKKPQIVAVAQPAAKSAPRLQPVAVAAIVPPATPKPAPQAKAVAPDRPPPKATTIAEPNRLAAVSIESCSRMKRAARAECMRPHVTRADNEMRRAYARAISRGVKGSTLRSYRNRWENVMLRRTSDPVYVTDSLPDMARRLDDKRPSRS